MQVVLCYIYEMTKENVIKGKHNIKETIKSLKQQLQWLLFYAKNYWWAMIIVTAFGFSGTVLTLFGSFYSKDLVDIITGHNTGGVVRVFAYMIGMALTSTIVTQFSSYFTNKLSLKVENDIKRSVFSKIMQADWEKLSAYHTGDLYTRWGSDVSTIANAILNFIPNLLIFLFRFGSAFFVMAKNDISFAVIAMSSIPFSIIISRGLARKLRNNNMKGAVINAKMSRFNQEAFSNIQIIKAFDITKIYIRRLKELQEEFVRMRLANQRVSIIITILLTIEGLIFTYIAYGWGIYRVWEGAISYGTMTLFLALSSTLSSAINSLVNMVPNAVMISAATRRVIDVAEIEQEKDNNRDAVEAFWKNNNNNGIGIVVRDIEFEYMNGNDVFSGVSFEAKPQEIIALVGPSGEGKTTMLRLLLSLIHAQKGDLFITGENGEKIPLDASARSLMAYVPQGNTMLTGTIAENLRYVKEDATDEEIIDALKLACAWEFVEKREGGINSEVREKGMGFSEGQSQRLSIARALLRKSPILLLDEATSALDPETENKLFENILKDKYPRTCILTTHRPSVLKNCARVYRVKSHNVSEMDNDEIDELMGIRR